MKTKNFLILGIIILLIIAIAIKIKSRPSLSNQPIKIGVATLLSGDYAILGENIVNTARLTVEKINKEGGINGRQLELVIEDSRLNSKDGLLAVSKLINSDGIKYIIGGMSSNGTMAAAPLANEKNVIILSPVTGGTNIDNAGEYIFRIANSDILAGKNLADAVLRLGHKRIGAIIEVTDYTLDLGKSFKEEILARGGDFVFEEKFEPGTKDFRSQVTKLKEQNAEAILIASQTGLSGGYFIKQSKDLNLKTVFFSDFTFITNPDVKKLVGSLDGIYFADPAYESNNPELIQFFTEYKTRFNREPAIPFHAAATHDSIRLLTRAIEKTGDDSAKAHDWLLNNAKNYRGFMGKFSLDQNGNSDMGFVIKIIKNNFPEIVTFK